MFELEISLRIAVVKVCQKQHHTKLIFLFLGVVTSIYHSKTAQITNLAVADGFEDSIPPEDRTFAPNQFRKYYRPKSEIFGVLFGY